MALVSTPDLTGFGLQELRTVRDDVARRLANLGAPPDEQLVVDRVTLGRLIGCPPNSVTTYTREGMPVLAAGRRGLAGQYDAIACLTWWRVKKRESPERERMRRDASIADINGRRLAEMEGRVVPREQVIREVQAFTKTLAEHVMALGRRMVLLGIIPGARQPDVEAVCGEALEEMAARATAQTA